MPRSTLDLLSEQVSKCNECERLRTHCLAIAKTKRRSYLDANYWGKPVPGFGDPHAKLLIVGLAPAAHGANRTGRMFTGDRSGEWLYRALYENHFSNQPTSESRDDGLTLQDAYITAVVRCAPPDNKPSPDEIHRCREYLEREFELFQKNVKVCLALGQIAFNAVWDLISSHYTILGKKPKFSHSLEFTVPRPNQSPIQILCSYHPSQQNTFTGRLTREMFDSVFKRARSFCLQ